MADPIPPAVVAPGGRLPGDAPRDVPRDGHSKPRRSVANLLLDRSLQLRYVLVVTLVSALITVVLGTLVYRQMTHASDNVEASVAVFDDEEFRRELAEDLHARDRDVVLALTGAGCGLALVLSLYLLVMTHRVAGPLYKVAQHFDDLADGRMRPVTPLRRGDLLTDFFEDFQEMHGAVRGRLVGDTEAMQAAASTLRAAAGGDAAVVAELDRLAAHAEARRRALS